MEANFKEYHKSLSEELSALKNRIRNLIGDAHWQTDGEHKEAILRTVLRSHISENLHLGKGFICFPDCTTSRQIDILITDKSKPTLFKDGELVITTPSSVKAVIEVKTKQSISQLRNTLSILSDQVEKIRTYQKCQAGLFIYEDIENASSVLSLIKEITNHSDKRVINWISIGTNKIIRYWPMMSRTEGYVFQTAMWRRYELEGLSQAYFLSNVVLDTIPSDSSDMQFAWFPIEGGKERFNVESAPL